MKTLDQIIAYVNRCSFDDDSWELMLSYCKERFKGGKIHRNTKSPYKSNYSQFLDWVDYGFGSGDYVRYGNTAGIICDSNPDCPKITAYLDFNGKLMDNVMEILEPERLFLLDDAEKQDSIEKQMFDTGLGYSVRQCSLRKRFQPAGSSFVAYEIDGKRHIGMYIQSKGTKHYFAMLLAEDEPQFDCWVDLGYAELQLATEKEAKQLLKVASGRGLAFNEKEKKYTKKPKRERGQSYWYINDIFNVISDRDNGSKRHTLRYEAGNYFTDIGSALSFAGEIDDMVKRK